MFYTNRKLGCGTNLQSEIKTTEKANFLPDSYGMIEGTPLVSGFNTKYGSCVPTGILNYIRTTYARAGRTDTITDQMALDLYTAVTGFNQNDPSTDNGTDPEVMMTYFMNNKIAGAKLNSFTRIDHTDEFALRNSVIKTGAVLLIFELAADQQNQQEWEPTTGAGSAPGSWGGHCVCSPSYSGGAYNVITWGEILTADRSYLNFNGYLVGAYELNITLDPEEVGVQDPADILARTIWAEARGDGKDGMQGVASVIMNRVKHPSWWGNSIISVCLKPWQFSSWNKNDPNRAKLLAVTTSDPEFEVAMNLAELAVKGILPDNTIGSNSYYALSMKTPPKWATTAKFNVQIGQQRYYTV